MSHARIRSITFKDGRAPLRVLHTRTRPGLNDKPENWNGKIVENARTIAHDPMEITGYVIVAVYADGTYNCATRVDHDLCPIPLTLWPAYVAEVVRKELVTPAAVRNVLDDE